MQRNVSGLILMEIIISVLIVSISLGIIFQNISVSLSSWSKGRRSLARAFQLESAGALFFFNMQAKNKDNEFIDIREWPFEVEDDVYKIIKLNIKDKDCIYLFLTGD